MRRFCFDKRGKKGFFFGRNANVMFEINLNCRTNFSKFVVRNILRVLLDIPSPDSHTNQIMV
jgi:hypothetical protein